MNLCFRFKITSMCLSIYIYIYIFIYVYFLLLIPVISIGMISKVNAAISHCEHRIHDNQRNPCRPRNVLNLIRICVAADSNEDWQTDDWNVPVIIINLLHHVLRPSVISLQFDLAASSPIPFAIAPAIVHRMRLSNRVSLRESRTGTRPPSRPPSESLHSHLIRLFQSSIIQFTRCDYYTPCHPLCIYTHTHSLTPDTCLSPCPSRRASPSPSEVLGASRTGGGRIAHLDRDSSRVPTICPSRAGSDGTGGRS